MTERYSIAIVMIALLLAAGVFAASQIRRNTVRQRRGRRIDIGTGTDH